MTYNQNLKEENLNFLVEDNESAVFRAAGGNLEEGQSLNYSAQVEPSKIIPADKESVGPWEPKNLAFLDQHVFLGENTDCQEAYDFIVEQLTEFSRGFKNFRDFPEEYKVVGYHFDETRHGCYRIQLFNFEGKLGVNCTRLEGDSLAVSQMWGLLKNVLHKQQFYEDPFLMQLEAETDDEDFFSDFDDVEFDLDSFKYLDLSKDPDFASKLIDEIEDLNVGTHALMLLNFNCNKESNLEFIAKDYGQTLFDKAVARLSDQNSRISLPDAVCISNLVCTMVAAAALAVTAEQFKTIVDTAENWCSETGSRKSVVPTASEEAAHNLTRVLRPLFDSIPAEQTDDLDSTTQLTNMIEKTNFDTVRNNVDAFLTTN